MNQIDSQAFEEGAVISLSGMGQFASTQPIQKTSIQNTDGKYAGENIESTIENIKTQISRLMENKKSFDESVIDELSKHTSSKTSLVPQYQHFVLEYAKSMLDKGCAFDEVILSVRNLGQFLNEQSDHLRAMGYAPQPPKKIKVRDEAKSASTPPLEQTSPLTAPTSPPWDDEKNIPIQWKTHKIPGDKPPTFIRRHYASYVSTMKRDDLARLDPGLWTATENWLNYKDNKLPDDMPLETRHELAAQWRDRIRAEGLTPSIVEALDDPKATKRLASRLVRLSETKSRS